jgi:hypothetical protein
LTRTETGRVGDVGDAEVRTLGATSAFARRPVPLGEGVIDVKGVYEVLKDGEAEYTTLEVGGDENLLASMKFLESLGV